MSQIIDQAVEGLNARLPEGGLGSTIAIEIKDEGVILINETGAHAQDGESDCRLIANARTFEGLMKGSINPMTSVMLGKLKVKGDASVALKLGKVFG